MTHSIWTTPLLALAVSAPLAVQVHAQSAIPDAPAPPAASFAVLRAPSDVPNLMKVTFGYSAAIRQGPSPAVVCGDIIRTRAYASIDGSVIGLRAGGVAVNLAYGSVITDAVLTGGGVVTSRRAVRVEGRITMGAAPIDISGDAPQVTLCTLAGTQASARVGELAALEQTSGLDLGRLIVRRSQTARIPASGSLGSGDVVIDATDIHLNPFATFGLVGSPTTKTVVVRVSRSLYLSYGAKIALIGLAPEQVLFTVQGPIHTKAYTKVFGTLFSQSTIDLGYNTQMNGALIASQDITLAPYAQVSFAPFAGW